LSYWQGLGGIFSCHFQSHLLHCPLFYFISLLRFSLSLLPDNFSYLCPYIFLFYKIISSFIFTSMFSQVNIMHTQGLILCMLNIFKSWYLAQALVLQILLIIFWWLLYGCRLAIQVLNNQGLINHHLFETGASLRAQVGDKSHLVLLIRDVEIIPISSVYSSLKISANQTQYC
jgi:hypothetical protein